MQFFGMRPWVRLDPQLLEFILASNDYEYDPHNFGRAVAVAWHASEGESLASLIFYIRMGERRRIDDREAELCDEVISVAFSGVADFTANQLPGGDRYAEPEIDYYMAGTEDPISGRIRVSDFDFGVLSCSFSFATATLTTFDAGSSPAHSSPEPTTAADDLSRA